jgi:hypothetical protein
MSIAGLGSVLGAVGTDYNFTKMTNKQFLSAVNSLASDGKISQTDAAQLGAIAEGVDSVPISGSSPSTQQVLSDTSSHDFLSEVQNTNNWVDSNAGSVGGAMYASMLTDLENNQGTSATPQGTTLSVDA